MENFLTWIIVQVTTTFFTSPPRRVQQSNNNNNNNNNNNKQECNNQPDQEDSGCGVGDVLSAIYAGVLLLTTILITTFLYVSDMFSNVGLTLREGWAHPTGRASSEEEEEENAQCDDMAQELLAPKMETVLASTDSGGGGEGDDGGGGGGGGGEGGERRCGGAKRSLTIRKTDDKLTKGKHQELRIVIDFRDIRIVNAAPNRETGKVFWWSEMYRDKLWNPTTTTTTTTMTAMMMMMVGANSDDGGQLKHACSLRYVHHTHQSLLHEVYDYLQQLLQIVGDGCTISGTEEQVIIKILMVKNAIDLWLRCQRDEMLDETESEEEKKEVEERKDSTDINGLMAGIKNGSNMTLSNNEYVVSLNPVMGEREARLNAVQDRDSWNGEGGGGGGGGSGSEVRQDPGNGT